MKNPTNRFKARLALGEQQIGIWNSIGQSTVAEMLATAGYDWIVLDTEHSPTEVTDVLPSLQAIAGYPGASAVVRPAWNDTVLIKRHLDQGAQSLIIPYVQSAAEAASAVAATRYPPLGMRGVAGITRASRFGSVEDYAKVAHEEICVIVQIETQAGLDNLEAIAGVEGVDGVFIGPADLAASLGYPGDTKNPAVQSAIRDALARLKAVGTPSGILALDAEFIANAIDWGTRFTAVATGLRSSGRGRPILAGEPAGSLTFRWRAALMARCAQAGQPAPARQRQRRRL